MFSVKKKISVKSNKVAKKALKLRPPPKKLEPGLTYNERKHAQCGHLPIKPSIVLHVLHVAGGLKPIVLGLLFMIYSKLTTCGKFRVPTFYGHRQFYGLTFWVSTRHDLIYFIKELGDM